jgi:DNA topoisomerase IA
LSQRPIRKEEVELLERMEREPLGRTVVDEALLESLHKRGMIEQRRDVWTLTTRARTYLLRRKTLARGKRKKAPRREESGMGS